MEEFVFSCYVEPCRYSPNSSLGTPGVRLRVGREFRLLEFGNGNAARPQRSDMPFSTNVYTVEMDYVFPEGKFNSARFLVDTGATVSALTFEDYQTMPKDMRDDLELGVDRETNIFVITKFWVSKIDHIPISHVLTRVAIPFKAGTARTVRLMGLELLEHFPYVRFHCGKVQFFTDAMPAPDDATLQSKPLALTLSKRDGNNLWSSGHERFFVNVSFRGHETPFMVDTGLDSTHVAPFPDAISTGTVSFRSTTSGEYRDKTTYEVELKIMGRSYSTSGGMFGPHAGIIHVLGSDVLQELDVHMVRSLSGNETQMFIRECLNEN